MFLSTEGDVKLYIDVISLIYIGHICYVECYILDAIPAKYDLDIQNNDSSNKISLLCTSSQWAGCLTYFKHPIQENIVIKLIRFSFCFILGIIKI